MQQHLLDEGLLATAHKRNVVTRSGRVYPSDGAAHLPERNERPVDDGRPVTERGVRAVSLGRKLDADVSTAAGGSRRPRA